MNKSYYSLTAWVLAVSLSIPAVAVERDVDGQFVEVMAIDSATGRPKTGASTVTLYVSIDGGTLGSLTDTSATEVSSSNAPGLYRFDLEPEETDGKALLFTGTSSTTGVDIVPRVVYTIAPNASVTSIDGNGKLLLQATQTGVTIPTVTEVTNRVTANTDQIEGDDAMDYIEDRTLAAANYFDPTTDEVDADVVKFSGSATAANNAELVFDTDFAANYDATADAWKTSVTHWLGTALATPDSAGHPKVTIKDGTGTGEIDTSNGRVMLTDAQAASIANESALVVASDPGGGATLDAGSEISQSGYWVKLVLSATVSEQNDAYNGMLFAVYDAADPERVGVGRIIDTVVNPGVATYIKLDSSIASVVGTIESDPVWRIVADAPSQLVTDAVTATTIQSNAITAAKIAADAIGAGELAADAGTELAGAVWVNDTRTLTAPTNITSDDSEIETASGVVTASLSTGAATDLVTDVWDAETRSLTDKAGFGLSASAVDSIWDEPEAGHDTADSIGERVIANLDAAIGTRASQASVDDLPPQSYFEVLFENAPTFSEAMDGQGYTMDRAENLDNLDQPVSEVRAQMPSLLVSTTIDGTPADQSTLVLAEGPSNDGALAGALVIVTNDVDPEDVQKAIGLVKKYDGGTHTVTLVTDPGVFTIADGDKVDVIATGSPAALWLGGAP